MDKVTAMDSETAAEAGPAYEDLPEEHVIIDQIVAYNMRHWRGVAGMTQQELGNRIGLSPANVSAAERSADGGRERRRFDAHTLAMLAIALGVPLIALFLPPNDDGLKVRYVFQNRDEDAGCLDMGDLLRRVVMTDSDDDTQVMDAYREHLRSTVARYMDPEWAEIVASWLREVEDGQMRADRAARLRERSNELAQAAAELRDLADAIGTPGDES